MVNFFLPTSYNNIVLIPQSKKVKNIMEKGEYFDSPQGIGNKKLQIDVKVYDLEKSSFLKNEKPEFLAKSYTKYGVVECFKVDKKILYIMKNKGCLLAQPDNFKLFLSDFEYFPFFILTIVVLYNQWQKEFICLHSGCFKYKGRTFLAVGRNGSGKSTFLLNLKKGVPRIEFICDDLTFIFVKNNRVFCKGILNSYQDSIDNYKNENSFEHIDFDQLFNQNSPISTVDKVLFLNITQKEHTICRKLNFSRAYHRFLSSTTLWNTFDRDQFKKGVEILFHVVEEVNCISLELGTDIKNGEKNERKIFSRILEAR